MIKATEIAPFTINREHLGFKVVSNDKVDSVGLEKLIASTKTVGTNYLSISADGLSFKGTIVVPPSASALAPTHSANLGTLWATSAGILYINIDNATAWQKVGAQ